MNSNKKSFFSFFGAPFFLFFGAPFFSFFMKNIDILIY